VTLLVNKHDILKPPTVLVGFIRFTIFYAMIAYIIWIHNQSMVWWCMHSHGCY